MTEVHWLEMDHPADTTGLQGVLAGPPIERLALLMRTEGHTGANDTARQLARMALDPLLAPLADAGRAAVVLANGCEGVATPGAYALVRRAGDPGAPATAGLRIGLARSSLVPADVIGTPQMIDRVAATVAQAVADAGLLCPAVALVLVKQPALAASACATEPWRADLRRGRALAALGVAVALGEIARDAIAPPAIASDLSLYSRHAMTFAGPECDRIEAIVLGQLPLQSGMTDNGLRIAVCHPSDLLDAGSIRRLLLAQGLGFDAAGELREPGRVRAVLSKAGPQPDGRVRGARTAIFGSALAPDSHMRAAQSGLLGGLFGSTRFFVSGDPVQQAPAGGGVAAVIVQHTPTP